MLPSSKLSLNVPSLFFSATWSSQRLTPWINFVLGFSSASRRTDSVLLAATTAKKIGETTQIPFLRSTAAMCFSILKSIEVIQFCGDWHNIHQKRIDNQIEQGRSC
jgi:hypothetical protein